MLGPRVSPCSFGAAVGGDAQSRRGAQVAFSVWAVDVVDGPRAVTCTPGSGGLFGMRNTRVFCTSVDTRGNMGRATFLVQVRGAAEQAISLRSRLARLGLSKWLLRELTAQVGRGQLDIGAGHPAAARARFESVRLTVRNNVGRGGLSRAEAYELGVRIRRIRAVLAP